MTLHGFQFTVLKSLLNPCQAQEFLEKSTPLSVVIYLLHPGTPNIKSKSYSFVTTILIIQVRK